MSLNTEKRANQDYSLLPLVNPQTMIERGEVMQPRQDPAAPGWVKTYRNVMDALEAIVLMLNLTLQIFVHLFTIIHLPFLFLWSMCEGFRYLTGPAITYVY